MMMITGRETFHSNPTVQVPPWDNDPTDHTHTHNTHNIHSPLFLDDLEMSQYDDVSEYYDDDIININNNNINDAFASDHFRMYEFKIRRCSRARSHDWTECPYAHPGEKARRRDPRKIIYSGNPCPEFRKGACFRGDTCEYAHGVFECWLHPSRYRTQPCKDGVLCRRRICFFAHTPEQIRSVFGQNGQNGSTHLTHLTHGSTHLTGLGQLTELTQCDSFDGSPSRYSLDSFVGMGNGLFGSSPTSTLFPASGSPPMSPVGQTSVNELTTTIRNMHIGNGHNGLRLSGGGGGGACFSTRSLSMLRPGYNSLPSTPTRNPARVNGNVFDNWEQEVISEEPVMERVESGKGIRAMMYEKLSRENSLVGRVGRGESGQDDGWVSELVN